MITIEKEVKVTIDGADVGALSDICEMARRYMDRERGAYCSAKYEEEHMLRIRRFLCTIFDGL